jgi:hypothetical protein
MPALRVALYARVSSEQQTEQGTIASQVAVLKARIVEDGFHLEPVVSRRHFFFGAPDWHHVTGTMTAALSDLRGFVGERR